MFRCRCVAIIAAIQLLAGCLPVELDVAPDGGLVISRQEGWFLFQPATGDVRKLRDAGADRPVFARLSPDGSRLLTVSEVKGGLSMFELRIGPAAGGPSTLLLKTRNPAYLLFSPDGSQVAMTRMSTKRHEPGKDEEALELVLLNAESGEVRRLAQRVGPLFRWLGAGEELLAAQVVRKTDQNHLLADLVRIDSTSGNAVPVARVLAGEDYHLDVARDGRRAAVCAYDAGPADSEFVAADFPRQRLLLIDLTTGIVRKSEQAAAFAIYAPDGDSMLIGGIPYSGTLSVGTKLYVADADGANLRAVAEDLYVAAAIGGTGQVYPGWIDRRQIFYFSERLVYGRTGRALSLMTVSRDGGERRCVQHLIDRAALSADAAR